MKEAYSLSELRELSTEAASECLLRPYNPLGDQTLTQKQREEGVRRKTVIRLMRRYGDEIWNICLGIGGYNPELGPTGLACLAGLERAAQPYNQTTFEEFLVRNALKKTAQRILNKISKLQ
jgi:hypothetical protein